MNLVKLEQAARLIIEGIGEDPNREGLIETPKRFAKMMAEQCAFCEESNERIAERYNKCFSCNSTSMVIVKDIPCFSRCEHHLALMYNMRISVGYIPCGKVIGLSKIARIATAVCKRLQIQERIGEDIADILELITGTKDVIVYIEAEHSCITARGVCKIGTVTKTTTLRGNFSQHSQKIEFYAMLK